MKKNLIGIGLSVYIFSIGRVYGMAGGDSISFHGIVLEKDFSTPLLLVIWFALLLVFLYIAYQLSARVVRVLHARRILLRTCLGMIVGGIIVYGMVHYDIGGIKSFCIHINLIERVIRFLASFFCSVLGIAVIFLLLLILRRKGQDKKLIHGPSLVARTGDAKTGALVGTYKKTAIPHHIRTFSQSRDGEAIYIPYDHLCRTVTVIGDMGCGKSRLMLGLHNSIKKQYPHIPILIHDPKAEWLRTCYNPETDIIFSPYDTRSVGWALWDDLKNNPHIRHAVISTAIESHHSGNADRFWSDSAIELLQGLCVEHSITDAAQAFAEKKEKNLQDKTFMSVYSTARIGFLDMTTIELSSKPKRTLHELINHQGRIFLLNNPSSAKEQHGALTLFLTAFLLKLVSLPDVQNPDEIRASVVMDEALTFHLPREVEKAIFTQARSKGIAIIASAQRLPSKTYGERGAWGDNAAYIFGMRVSDLDTRTAFSKRIGGIKYEEKQQSISKGNKNNSRTESMAYRQYEALAPEDFGNLKDREFVLYHDQGIAVGVTNNVPAEQRPIEPFVYEERQDVIKFMKNV